MKKLAFLMLVLFWFAFQLSAQACPQAQPNLVVLEMGDMSADGHGKFEVVYLCSSLERDAIRAAYQAGAEKVGFDFMRTVATEFEEPTIKQQHLAQLRQAGLEIELEYEHEFEEADSVVISTRDYHRMWLKIVALGDEAFSYYLLESKDWIYIGGYGLFEL